MKLYKMAWLGTVLAFCGSEELVPHANKVNEMTTIAFSGCGGKCHKKEQNLLHSLWL